MYYQATGQDEQHVVYNIPLDMSLVVDQQPVLFSIPNLSPNTSYVISVSAATQDDDGFLEGPRSNDLVAKTVVDLGTSIATSIMVFNVLVIQKQQGQMKSAIHHLEQQQQWRLVLLLYLLQL